MKLSHILEAKYYQDVKRIKSAIPLIRRASKVRGKTQHSGRGSYMMYGEDFDRGQAINNIISKIPEWKMKDIIIDAAQTPDGDLFIAFSDYVDHPYKHFKAPAPDERTKRILGTMMMSFNHHGLEWYYDRIPGLRSIV